MTWNISYAYGLGSDGIGGYIPRAKEHYQNNLKLISEAISTEDPDIALLQEVDFDSARSHHVNQLEDLSRTSGLIYREGIVSWDFPYVPYPGVSPKNHFGKVVSGGGILSKYPLISVQNDLLPKPKENSRLYNLFYLHRYLQIAQIKHPGLQCLLTFANLHLEAFSKENRELHLVKLQNRLIDYTIDLAAGDFNGPIEIAESAQLSDWTAKPAPEPTFPSNSPTEVLDGFVIKNKNIRLVNLRVINTGTCSDHFPVVLEIEIS